MKDLQQLQREVGEWSREQFGDNVSKATGHPTFSQNALTGLVEEVGELNHVTICYHQGRRGYDPSTTEGRTKYKADRDDAIADIMIFLLDYCEREKTDLLTLVNQTWDKVVSKRTVQNWEEHSHETQLDGVDPPVDGGYRGSQGPIVLSSDVKGATISERTMKDEVDSSCPEFTRIESIPIPQFDYSPSTNRLQQNGVGWSEPSLESEFSNRVAQVESEKLEKEFTRPTNSYPTEKDRGNNYDRDCSKCGQPIHDTNPLTVCSSCYKPPVGVS